MSGVTDSDEPDRGRRFAKNLGEVLLEWVFDPNAVDVASRLDLLVVLPDYSEALNRVFRYQLTVIGQFAQAITAEAVGFHYCVRPSNNFVRGGASGALTAVRGKRGNLSDDGVRTEWRVTRF